MRGANLDGADWSGGGGLFESAGANLHGANLTGASLSGTDLTDVDLTNVVECDATGRLPDCRF